MTRVAAFSDLAALAAAPPDVGSQPPRSTALSGPEISQGAAPCGDVPRPAEGHGTQDASDASIKKRADLVARLEGLDVRGNDIEATRLETDWAVSVLEDLPKEHTLTALRHAADLCTRAANGELIVLEDEPHTHARVRGFQREISQAISDLNYAKNVETCGDTFVDLFVEDQSFKIIMDRFDLFHRLTGTPERKSARSAPEFIDRGRRFLADSDKPHDVWLQRRDSVEDMDAGIAAAEFRPERAIEALTLDVQHGKGIYASEETSATWSRFKDQKAPFISGASGAICTIAWSLRNSAPAGSTPEAREMSPEQLATSEAILGCHIARMVFGGHHSVSEGLIAAKASGFFENVPHPLEDYKGAMSAFQARMKELGVDHGERSLVQAAPDQVWNISLEDSTGRAESAGPATVETAQETSRASTETERA